MAKIARINRIGDTDDNRVEMRVVFFDDTTPWNYSSEDLIAVTNISTGGNLVWVKADCEAAIVSYASSHGITLDHIEWFTITNISEPDLVTLLTASRNTTYLNGTKKNTKTYLTSATVSSGVATFYLTDNNTSWGNAIFSNVYIQSIRPWYNDKTTLYAEGDYALSGDKKTLTLSVNKLSFTGTTILGINVLGTYAFVAANGATVYLLVQGD